MAAIKIYPSHLQRDFAYDMGVSAEKLNNPKIREALKEDIQKDFAKATVYYQTLNVQTISQEPKYSVRLSMTIDKPL